MQRLKHSQPPSLCCAFLLVLRHSPNTTEYPVCGPMPSGQHKSGGFGGSGLLEPLVSPWTPVSKKPSNLAPSFIEVVIPGFKFLLPPCR